jgi:glucose/mannose-6-phosphate isomerase
VSELTPEVIARADPAGMLGDVLAQPDQIEDALWRFESGRVPRADHPGGLVVAGMGGSAVGGDLAAAAAGSRAAAPIRSTRGYALEGATRLDSLVLCASYSGDTEETLSVYAAARELGIRRAAVTTGGRLAEEARADGVPVMGVPSGMQPRAGVVYMTVAALECAAACGAAPPLREEIDASAATLRAVGAEHGAGSAPDTGAKSLAAALAGRLPIVYGAGRTAAAARRWKTQLNENAKVAAFASELPEADHNEVCGFGGAQPAPMAAVFLDDDTLDPRLRRRIDVTADLLGGEGVAVHRVEAQGESPVARLLSLVMLGDLVSVYLAVLRGADPTPVEPIERLKGLLGS